MSASPSSAQPKQADVVASEASPEVISTQGLTEAGKAIQQHLKVDATNETDIIALLCAFEVRSVPDSITAGELMALVPTHSYTACFDVNFDSQPSWVAHSPCQRCTAVNQLLHVVRHSQSSFTRSALGIALLVTQCDSERQRAGVVPKVPAEILERFLASFMNRVTACGKRKVGEAFHMSSNIRSGIRLHDSDAFVANLEEACVSLLHSSTFVRRAMNKYLSSHSSNIWPCERLPTKPTRRALTSKDLEHPNETLRRFACDALHWWYYLQDPISRCELPLAIPECKDTILQWDDTETRSVRFVIVIMDPDGEKLSWHPFGRTGLTGSAHRDVDAIQHPASQLKMRARYL